jgi:hypothetical protein
MTALLRFVSPTHFLLPRTLSPNRTLAEAQLILVAAIPQWSLLCYRGVLYVGVWIM